MGNLRFADEDPDSTTRGGAPVGLVDKAIH